MSRIGNAALTLPIMGRMVWLANSVAASLLGIKQVLLQSEARWEIHIYRATSAAALMCICCAGTRK